jgi:hypothetical protein
MASAKERLTIFENIVARVGMDGDLPSEYSKAMSTLNGFNTYQAMQPPPVPQITPPIDAGGILPSEPTQGMPQDQSGLNQPMMP